MTSEMDVRLKKWELCHPLYPKARMNFRKMQRGYVSDAISDEEIGTWNTWKYLYPRIPPRPVFITAQTGSGKNYFITHNLREYAKRYGERILYISNRVALDYQQKKELAKLTHTNLSWNQNVMTWENIEVFENVTVLTYHKLSEYLQSKEEAWFRSFAYVVLDECHFFYSDSFFNAKTGYILEQIPKKFLYSVRIYMSATMEDVFEPIRFVEKLEQTGEDEPFPNSYCFPVDYSAYTSFFFSNLEQIEELLKGEIKSKDKWLIFVTSKDAGRKLTKKLNDLVGKSRDLKLATYIDSGSRRTDDTEERIAWENVKTNGKFETKVLVTTAVLDNGFSIKDKHIKNVVICSHDKTEFLQELGRCRLAPEQTVNLYIKKLSKKAYAQLNTEYKRREELIFRYFGDKDTTIIQNRFSKEGDPIAAVQSLWNNNEDICRSLISLVETEKGTLTPHFNHMARWRNRLLGEHLEYYESLQEVDEKLAPSAYKADWLAESTQSASMKPGEQDLDVKQQDQSVQELLSFLREQSATLEEMIEGEEKFETFSQKFVSLYRKAYPEDTSINRGRPTGGHKFIQNRLASIGKDFKEQYELRPAESNNKAYMLVHIDEEEGEMENQ